jgi:AraC family transcriptional regulator of arabinose operon
MRLVLSRIDLRPVIVSVGEVVYPPGGRLGPRWQHDVQLVLVHEGRARIAIDGGEPAILRAGEVRLLLPGHREQFAFAERDRTRHSWVQARLAGGPGAAMQAGMALAALPHTLPASTALTELVREAVDADRTPLSTAKPLLHALTAAAIWRYVGEAESQERGAHGVVARARAFLHAHLADPRVDLAQAARAAHVSPAHLVRRFKAELGITPMAYLWQRRVATGVDLLTHTGLPVGDIAGRTGFKSVYHFSRRVKDATGRAPSELRRARWEA